MNKEQYQSAFSWVEPSEAALERALEHAKPRERGRRPRLGAVMLAAILAVLLLTGGVFAANRWVSVRGAEELRQPTLHEKDSPEPEETLAPIRQVLELEHPDVQTYMGFTLPESYKSWANTPDCIALRNQMEYDKKLSAVPAEIQLNGVYKRYYGIDADGVLLTVEVLGNPWLSASSYFTTTGSFELVREEFINGFETAWVEYQGGAWGTSWHIFCRNETNACAILVSSTKSFDAAAEVVRDLTLVDTGVPMENRLNQYYALRQPELGEGWKLDYGISMERDLLNAKLEAPDTDLSNLYAQINLYNPAKKASVHVVLNRGVCDPVYQGETVLEELEINGLPAVLVENNGDPILRITNGEAGYQIVLSVNPRVVDKDVKIALIKEFAPALEVVHVGVREQGPREFGPFAHG